MNSLHYKISILQDIYVANILYSNIIAVDELIHDNKIKTLNHLQLLDSLKNSHESKAHALLFCTI